jgi:hypothetical protein
VGAEVLFSLCSERFLIKSAKNSDEFPLNFYGQSLYRCECEILTGSFLNFLFAQKSYEKFKKYLGCVHSKYFLSTT